MATINYKGMELQSIDECKVFEEPQEMLVWNPNDSDPIEKMVCAIIPYRHDGSVITTSGAFEYCAPIPENPAPRRATNRELAKWLAQGYGEVKYASQYAVKIHIEYGTKSDNDPCHESFCVRKWDDTEWHVPTVDYMGIKEGE